MSAQWHFVFTWKIENWNMCREWELESPVFAVQELPHERWYLKVIQGHEPTRMNLELRRCLDGHGDQDVEVTLGTYTEIMSGHDESFKCSQKMDVRTFPDHLTLFSESVDVSEWVGFDEEVLTLRCTLTKEGLEPELEETLTNRERPPRDADFGTPSSAEESYSVSGIGSLRCRPNRCTARTRIELFRRSFLWIVKDLDLTDPSREFPIRIESAQTNFGSFKLTLFYRKDTPTPRLWFEIRRIVQDYTKKTFATCSLTFARKNKRIVPFARDEHLFSGGPDDPWVLSPSDKKNARAKVRRNWVRDLVYEDRDMKIEVELFAAHEGYHRHLVGSPASALDDADSAFLSDFSRMDVKDIVLIAGDGKEVQASRIILAARSEVFQGMLKSDMNEKNTGRVKIPDFDAEVVECMVRFMHGECPDLTPEVAVELYKAAHMYDVPSLKALCSGFLGSNVTVETAPDVLALAKLYEVPDLTDSTKDFMRHHLPQVLHTEKWKDLLSENPDLAKEMGSQIMREKMEDV